MNSALRFVVKLYDVNKELHAVSDAFKKHESKAMWSY